jgi:hypothetical protein
MIVTPSPLEQPQGWERSSWGEVAILYLEFY